MSERSGGTILVENITPGEMLQPAADAVEAIPELSGAATHSEVVGPLGRLSMYPGLQKAIEKAIGTGNPEEAGFSSS
jgi:hypothetical protein